MHLSFREVCRLRGAVSSLAELALSCFLTMGGQSMTHTEPVTCAEFLARSLAANGTTHVFFIDAVLRRTLIELGTLGIQRVLGHSEKAVAYMADGYARIAGRPGVCFAQSVGAANLASGLQDAWL